MLSSDASTSGIVRSAGTVLLVEDSMIQRRMITETLEGLGYRVVEAIDGHDALLMLESARPDVVLLDVTMPGLDGWETLERIRRTSEIPVVMLTAHTQVLDRKRGLQGGADDYLSKPFQPEELDVRLEAVLRRARAARRDSLTGLLNRHAFDEQVEALFRDPSLARHGFTLLVCDIDDLGRINIDVGEQAGDRVIRDIGRLALGGLRLDEEVYRLEGGRFGILLVGGSERGEHVARLLCDAVAQHPHLPSISTGVASFPEHARACLQLLQEADSALWQAKQMGIGAVVVAGSMVLGFDADVA